MQSNKRYPTSEAEESLRRFEFETLAERSRRDLLASAAEELLDQIRTLAGSPRDDGDPTGVTWRMPNRRSPIHVAIDQPPAVRVEPLDAQGVPVAVSARTVALEFNPITERFESTEDEPFTAPGRRPVKRNALTVIVETCIAAARG